jgi:maltose alpha-D-glucosyltransferase / alpha-amylase
MELAYSLALTLPGTPVLLYGEELGLGDDQRMADREAVRIPMQWSARPGAGFTTAPTERLPRRPLADGRFGYGKVNVEAQRRDTGSFLNWMERAIRTRKEWPAFGWGRWRVLGSRSSAVLAHVATWDGSSVLAVHNFSDRPARATLRLPDDAIGDGWAAIFGSGDAEAPAARADRVSVQLEPYGYRWFGRQGPA